MTPTPPPDLKRALEGLRDAYRSGREEEIEWWSYRLIGEILAGLVELHERKYPKLATETPSTLSGTVLGERDFE